MHCNLRLPEPRQPFPTLITTPCQKFEVAQPIHCRIIAFLLLIHYFRCDLDLWPWTFAVYRLWHDETLYQIWTQSSSPRRNYCDFSVSPLRVALGSRIIFTKFDLRQLIRVWFIAFLCRYVVTLWPWPLTYWPWKFVEYQPSRTTFARNWAIPGWITNNLANFCTRYVTLWPWTFSSYNELLQHFGCHAFKLRTKFERNGIIHRPPRT